MKLKNTLLVLLAAAILAAGVFTIVSADTDSILEFFGFKKPEQTATATPAAFAEPKTQSTPKPDANPFGVQTRSDSSGLGLSDWDDPFSGIDPALIEPDDDSETEAKAGSSGSLYDDPFANSFSPSSFDSVPSGSGSSGEQKNGPRIFIDRPTPTPRLILHRFPNNPVFCPMRELPRCGFPTGRSVEIKESIAYAKTSMSLSIPAQNVSEDIVIVPLVDDTFPVESLGNNIGLLEGSGPGEEDLFVLAAHNHLNTQEQGPFAKLSALKESDLVFVNSTKGSRTFVVYANEKFAADDIDGLLEYARPGCMILITCEDESVEGGYLNRRVVFAEAKTD